MNSRVDATPSWSTAAFGDAADTSPMELSELGDHLDRCRGSRGRMFGVRCAADAMHGFVASRIVTTLVAVTLILGAGFLLL
jgi:hypothetical protein